jgi:hypothetical protein
LLVDKKTGNRFLQKGDEGTEIYPLLSEKSAKKLLHAIIREDNYFLHKCLIIFCTNGLCTAICKRFFLFSVISSRFAASWHL